MQATNFLTRAFAAQSAEKSPSRIIVGGALFDRYRDEQVLAGVLEHDSAAPVLFKNAEVVRGGGDWEINRFEYPVPPPPPAPAPVAPASEKK